MRWLFSLKVFCYLTVCLSLAFDINDLRQINGSCYSFGVCRKREGFRLDNHFESSLPPCECDDKCIDYGDCCLNANAYDSVKMKSTYKDFHCLKFEKLQFYAKVKCDDTWKTPYVSKLCLSAINPSMKNINDPLIRTPVTSLETNVTYANYYCALCNNENFDNVENWNLILSCSDKYNISQDFVKRKLTYNNHSWGVFLNDSEDQQNFVPCSITPLPKESISRKVRRCRILVDSCSPRWNNKKDVDLCQSYMNTVYGPPPLNNNELLKNYYQHSNVEEENVMYKNYHCSICNFLKVTNITCYPRTLRKIFDAPQFTSLSVLFNFGHKKSNCQKGEIWDPFNSKCRRVFCVNSDQVFVNDRCVKATANNSSLFNSTLTDSKLKCDKIYLQESEFVERVNSSIYVPTIQRTYNSEEYVVEGDGVFICIPKRYSSLMAYLTLFGLGLSCVCIVVHLIVFAIIPDIRNLSGKNLASFSLALLIAYSCFLVSAFEDSGVDDCVLTASFMYYFFLASFFWMNVMAFDVWRTLKMATSELRLSTGKQWRKFILYSFYAWCFPLLLLSLVIVIDSTQPSWISHSNLPELGHRNCWFRQKNAILFYFALPLALIMLMNIIFFILSVRIITVSSARSTDNFQRSQPQRGQLKLYLRLALLMGLSWISGIIAGYLQEERVWYVFIILNAFQGLFILLGFTFTDKVYQAFLNKYPFSKGPKTSRTKMYKSEPIIQSNDSNQTQLSNISSTGHCSSPLST